MGFGVPLQYQAPRFLDTLIWGFQGTGFRVQGSGFRVQGSGFRMQGSGFRVQGSVGLGCGLEVWGGGESFGFQVEGLGCGGRGVGGDVGAWISSFRSRASVSRFGE